jgi:hypothetical protein
LKKKVVSKWWEKGWVLMLGLKNPGWVKFFGVLPLRVRMTASNKSKSRFPSGMTTRKTTTKDNDKAKCGSHSLSASSGSG